MLTQVPTPDPKCNLKISSFLTLRNLLDCLVCTRNSLFIVFLLWMGRRNRWVGWLIHIRVWIGREQVGIISVFVKILFALLFFGL